MLASRGTLFIPYIGTLLSPNTAQHVLGEFRDITRIKHLERPLKSNTETFFE